MSAQYEKLERCYEYYRSVTDFTPRVGLILGSRRFPTGIFPGSRYLPYRDMTESFSWDISAMCRQWP